MKNNMSRINKNVMYKIKIASCCLIFTLTSFAVEATQSTFKVNGHGDYTGNLSVNGIIKASSIKTFTIEKSDLKDKKFLYKDLTLKSESVCFVTGFTGQLDKKGQFSVLNGANYSSCNSDKWCLYHKTDGNDFKGEVMCLSIGTDQQK
jgi:hypothetical protein